MQAKMASVCWLFLIEGVAGLAATWGGPRPWPAAAKARPYRNLGEVDDEPLAGSLVWLVLATAALARRRAVLLDTASEHDTVRLFLPADDHQT